MRAFLAILFLACASVAAVPMARADVAIPQEERAYRMGLRLETTPQGARIASVGREGAARRMGLREGDVILAINWQYVRAMPAERVQQFASGQQYRPVSVLIVRNNRDVIEFKFPQR